MSQQNQNHSNELRRYSLMLSKKILLKFGINNSESKDAWGWFVDPELNYSMFNKNKYQKNVYTSKHISIPSTIQEYPTIRSMKSINNFQDKSFETDNHEDFKHKMNTRTNTRTSMYVNIIGLVTLISLMYILIIL